MGYPHNSAFTNTLITYTDPQFLRSITCSNVGKLVRSVRIAAESTAADREEVVAVSNTEFAAVEVKLAATVIVILYMYSSFWEVK